jgi:hypothetical protein
MAGNTRSPGRRDARFHDYTLWRLNGKRVETKLETKLFPPPASLFLLDKMKIPGNEENPATGNERPSFGRYSFPFNGWRVT